MSESGIIKVLFLCLIFLGVSLEAAGDILLKKWALETKNVLLLAGIFTYILGGACWAISLKYDFLSKAISLFSILNLILVVIIGMIMFNEDVSAINKIGIGLGIVSIILIEI